MNKALYEYHTIEEISTPKDGYVCITDSWWPLTKDGKVIIYDKYKPQQNKNKEISEQISKRLYSGEVVFIPVAFYEEDPRGWY